MDLEDYKFNISTIKGLVDTHGKLNFVLDLTSLLRGNAKNTLDELSAIPHSKCCWYVIKEFNDQMINLIADKRFNREIFFMTDNMSSNVINSWDIYNAINPYTLEGYKIAHDMLEDILKKDRTKTFFITGNETEAWYHMLSLDRAGLILITDTRTYLVDNTAFANIKYRFGLTYAVTKEEIEEYNEMTYQNVNCNIGTFGGVVSDSGAEGLILSDSENKYAIKIFDREVSTQKWKKLGLLMNFADKKPNMAWPIEAIYSTRTGKIIGFKMKLFKNIFPLSNIFYTTDLSPHNKWKLAMSLMSQVIFLYINNIQVGDYNLNNFAVTKGGDIVLLDMDSYSIGRYGTEFRGKQSLTFDIDYTHVEALIKADYMLLYGVIFQILTDGIWPIFYDEDIGKGRYKFKDGKNPNPEDLLAYESIPLETRAIFNDVFERDKVINPFKIYFTMLFAENKFLDNKSNTIVEKYEYYEPKTKTNQNNSFLESILKLFRLK